MSPSTPSRSLQDEIARLQPYGLGARGDTDNDPGQYPQRNLHLLLAVSGSVASIKAPLIVSQLVKYERVEVQVVATASSLHFFDKTALEQAHAGRVKVWTDAEEWKVGTFLGRDRGHVLQGRLTSELWQCAQGWTRMGDPVLHIELRRWADVVLIAPCSANTLAKINHGICDNTLTSVLRALPTFVPVLLFPAMNTQMYSHPLTARQIKFVQDELSYTVHGPIAKTLACGDVGLGAMFEWTDIVRLVQKMYDLKERAMQ
ncbi:BQ2448_4277 [Microbotryum intermedium]|uniref:BQ2448_4277 protein n=1 Tax=Microbotryum intermedium TaxID=269621 RepID=A0A238FFZ9_9BASI|nr:BQ2448_4277 [Microbotryum intermedium]